MFNFFKPKPEAYAKLINRIGSAASFDTFPLFENDEKFAVITLLVILSQVDCIPSKNKIMFLEVLSSRSI